MTLIMTRIDALIKRETETGAYTTETLRELGKDTSDAALFGPIATSREVAQP